jgi:hypothetical protein
MNDNVSVSWMYNTSSSDDEGVDDHEEEPNNVTMEDSFTLTTLTKNDEGSIISNTVPLWTIVYIPDETATTSSSLMSSSSFLSTSAIPTADFDKNNNSSSITASNNTSDFSIQPNDFNTNNNIESSEPFLTSEEEYDRQINEHCSRVEFVRLPVTLFNERFGNNITTKSSLDNLQSSILLPSPSSSLSTVPMVTSPTSVSSLSSSSNAILDSFQLTEQRKYSF